MGRKFGDTMGNFMPSWNSTKFILNTKKTIKYINSSI